MVSSCSRLMYCGRVTAEPCCLTRRCLPPACRSVINPLRRRLSRPRLCAAHNMSLAGVWRQWVVALASEALGTAALVALGSAALQPGYALTHPALAFGAAVTWLVDALAPVSGAHLNPAVSLAALLAGLMPPHRALAYAVAQCAGATLGLGALVALGVARAPLGCTMPAPHVSAAAAAAIEGLMTGALVAHCLALGVRHDPQRPDTSAAIKVGFTVAGLVYSGGPLTSAGLNPARSLAGALIHGCWKHHWVYWVGPLGGAGVATLLYHAGVWLAPPPSPPPPPAAETLPLTDTGHRQAPARP